MSALLLATLMDCPEGCKDARPGLLPALIYRVQCYIRCGQSVDRTLIFLSATTRCIWQLDGPLDHGLEQCTARRGATELCFVLDTRHSILVHCISWRGAVQRCVRPTLDTAPIFKTKLHFKLLSSLSRCTAQPQCHQMQRTLTGQQGLE